jgi:hypothetical protein
MWARVSALRVLPEPPTDEPRAKWIWHKAGTLRVLRRPNG